MFPCGDGRLRCVTVLDFPSFHVVFVDLHVTQYLSLCFCRYFIYFIFYLFKPNPGLRGGRRECYHSATVARVSVDTCLLVLSMLYLKIYM